MKKACKAENSVFYTGSAVLKIFKETGRKKKCEG